MPRRIRDAKIQNSRYGKQERLNKCKWTLHCGECPNDWCEQRSEKQ